MRSLLLTFEFNLSWDEYKINYNRKERCYPKALKHLLAAVKSIVSWRNELI
jgi:hypothetical protein